MLTLTHPTDAVEDVASLTFTAIRAQQVDATVTDAHVLRAFAFIDICRDGTSTRETRLGDRLPFNTHSHTDTARAIFIEVVSSTTVDRDPLADVGTRVVDTHLPSVAWSRVSDAFIDVLKQI